MGSKRKSKLIKQRAPFPKEKKNSLYNTYLLCIVVENAEINRTRAIRNPELSHGVVVGGHGALYCTERREAGIMNENESESVCVVDKWKGDVVCVRGYSYKRTIAQAMNALAGIFSSQSPDATTVRGGEGRAARFMCEAIHSATHCSSSYHLHRSSTMNRALTFLAPGRSCAIATMPETTRERVRVPRATNFAPRSNAQLWVPEMRCAAEACRP